MRISLLAILSAGAMAMFAASVCDAGAPTKGARGARGGGAAGGGATAAPVAPTAPVSTTPAKTTPAKAAATPATSPTSTFPAAAGSTDTSAAAAPAAPDPSIIPTGPAVPDAAGAAIVNEQTITDFDVFSTRGDKIDKKIGTMTLKVRTVSNVVTVSEDLRFEGKDKEIQLVSQITYRGTDDPVPQKASVSTYYGTDKLMEGVVAYSPKTGGGLIAKEDIKGYGDKNGKLLPKQLDLGQDVPVPAGHVLSLASTVALARRMLPQAGQLDHVVWLRLPKDYGYPGFSEYVDNCVMVRGQPNEDGRSEFTIKQMFPGGNAQVRTSMTFDADGKVLEIRVPSAQSGFIFRPAPPAPLVPVPAPPVKAASATK
jgi:hypothetical protein